MIGAFFTLLVSVINLNKWFNRALKPLTKIKVSFINTLQISCRRIQEFFFVQKTNLCYEQSHTIIAHRTTELKIWMQYKILEGRRVKTDNIKNVVSDDLVDLFLLGLLDFLDQFHGRLDDVVFDECVLLAWLQEVIDSVLQLLEASLIFLDFFLVHELNHFAHLLKFEESQFLF